jgi:hypothetical protein
MEQAEALYKRARKLRRAVDAVQPLLEAAQQEAEYLETVRMYMLFVGWLVVHCYGEPWMLFGRCCRLRSRKQSIWKR